jgi:hypothetical protein
VSFYDHKSLQGNVNKGLRSVNVHTSTRSSHREASSLYNSNNPHNQDS